MKEILFLNLRISIAIAIFYLAYSLFLSKDTFFVRNRFYLLFALVAAVLIPLIKIPVYATSLTGSFSSASNPVIVIHDGATGVDQFDVWAFALKILFYLYLVGIAFMLLKLGWGIRHIVQIIRNARKEKYGDIVIVSTRKNVSPFSVYRWLIISHQHLEHHDVLKIIQHEMVHSRQWHSLDLIIAEIVLAFQWFNPLAWFMKRAIVQNHEFIVDQQLLANGMEPKVYQYSLLNTIVQGEQFSFVNHFNTNLLKKRIRMMNKCESPKWYGIKNLMILVSLCAVVSLTATFETKLLAQETKIDTVKNDDSHSAKNVTAKVTKAKRYQVIKDTVVEDKSMKPGQLKKIIIIKDDVFGSNEDEAKKEIVVTTDLENDTAHHSISGRVEKIMIRGKGNGNGNGNPPLVIINGKKVSSEELDRMDPSDIERVDVWKDEASIEKYGADGKNGVVEVKTKTLKIDDGVKTGLTISEKDKSLDMNILDENKIKPDSPYMVTMVDNEGHTVYNAKTKDKSFQIPTDKLKNGKYFISVVNLENHYSCSDNYSLKHN